MDYWPKERTDSLLKLAEMLVVARLANGIDGFFWIDFNNVRIVSLLNADWPELDETVHPCRPEMFLASRLVFAKDAFGQSHRHS